MVIGYPYSKMTKLFRLRMYKIINLKNNLDIEHFYIIILYWLLFIYIHNTYIMHTTLSYVLYDFKKLIHCNKKNED